MNSIFNRVSLGVKLWLAPGVALCSLLCVASLGGIALREQKSTLNEWVQLRSGNLTALTELDEQVRALHAGSYQLLAWGAASYSAQQFSALKSELVATLPRVQVSADGYAGRKGFSESNARENRELVRAVASFGDAVRATLDVADVDQSVATTMMIKAEVPYRQMISIFDSMRRDQNTSAQKMNIDLNQSLDRLTVAGALVILACVAAVSISTLAVRSSILGPIKNIGESAFRLRRGDLTPRLLVAGRDEMAMTARSVAETVTVLRKMIGDVDSSVSSIDVALGAIASGSADLSVRSNRQAMQLKAAVLDTAELQSALIANARDLARAVAVAERSRGHAEGGAELVREVATVMRAIRESSSRVNEITAVIDSIAFQTNILSLNAAIEAAHAGSKGSGFAVVAMEVRALSARCANAAQEIKGLIADSSDCLESGHQLADQTGAAIERVVGDVQTLHQLLDDLAESGREQGRSATGIANALTLLDAMTGQNTELAQHAAAATEAMREESERLVFAMSAFRTGSSS